MSIWSQWTEGKITTDEALNQAEVWFGHTVAQAPGGQQIEAVIADLAAVGAAAAAAPTAVLAKAIEAPVDAFLTAKLGPVGSVPEADFNAAIDAAAAKIVALIQLQAANLKANMAAGAGQAAA